MTRRLDGIRHDSFPSNFKRPSFKTIQLGSFGDELTKKKKKKETFRFIYFGNDRSARWVTLLDMRYADCETLLSYKSALFRNPYSCLWIEIIHESRYTVALPDKDLICRVCNGEASRCNFLSTKHARVPLFPFLSSFFFFNDFFFSGTRYHYYSVNCVCDISRDGNSFPSKAASDTECVDIYYEGKFTYANLRSGTNSRWELRVERKWVTNWIR